MSQPGQPATAAPPTQGTAVAVRDEIAQDLTIRNIAGRNDVERIETTVTIPTDYQYAIPIKGKKLPNGEWDNSGQKIGLLADAYNYLNRVIGCSFFLPEYVHDEDGKRAPNPIHRKDYIYLRLGGVWYNAMGQLVMATEDVEVNFNLTWMDARINAFGATVIMNDDPKSPGYGLPKFDAFGNPMVKISPEAELKALKTLSQLRTFGPRYAQTVARVRLLKMAVGVSSVPDPHKLGIRPFALNVVGWRDKMTPQERIVAAGGTVAALYGRPDDIKPLTQSEMDEVGPDVDPDTEQIDREAITNRIAAEADDEPQAAPKREFTAEELADLDQ